LIPYTFPTTQFANVTKKRSSLLALHFCNVAEREIRQFSKNRNGFEKGNRANHGAPGTEKNRKIALYQLIYAAITMARFRAVQLGRVIDMDPAIAGYWGALQCVLTGRIACPFSPAGRISPVTGSDELRCCRRRNTSITNSVRRRKEELPKSTRKQSPSIQTPSCT